MPRLGSWCPTVGVFLYRNGCQCVPCSRVAVGGFGEGVRWPFQVLFVPLSWRAPSMADVSPFRLVPFLLCPCASQASPEWILGFSHRRSSVQIDAVPCIQCQLPAAFLDAAAHILLLAGRIFHLCPCLWLGMRYTAPLFTSLEAESCDSLYETVCICIPWVGWATANQIITFKIRFNKKSMSKNKGKV